MIDAFLKLLVDRGWGGFTLRDVAAAVPTGLAELYAVYPSRLALVAAFMADIDRQVLAGTTPPLDPDETPRDRLFDTMMRRYDALQPHKAAVAALMEGLRRDPLALPALSRLSSRSMAAVLESAGIPADGWTGAFRQNGLAAIHLAVLRVWLNDTSADMSKTMAALDHRLKRAERCAQVLDRITGITRRRPRSSSPDATGPAAAADGT